MNFRPTARRVAALAFLALAGACRTPYSIESDVELATDRGVVRAVSTESGIFALSDVVPQTGELSFRYRKGNGFFDDVARVVRQGDALAVFAPATSRLNHARFAAYPASGADELYLETRDDDDDPELIECRLFEAGRRGDLLVFEDEDVPVADVAGPLAGAGIFAWRNKTMELVGILNGVYTTDPPALAFIGLDEMATLIPAESSFFARRVTTRRSDFEYGVPRDFEGELPSVADPDSALDPTAPAPVGDEPAEPAPESSPPDDDPADDDSAPRAD